MKALLPILKTKLFLLSFISAWTMILATTVPQIKSYIAPEKVVKEKITAEEKMIAQNIKKHNKTVRSSGLTSLVSPQLNNAVAARMQTDKADHYPVDFTIIDGNDANNPGAGKTTMKIYNKNRGRGIYDDQMGGSEIAEPAMTVDSPQDDGIDILMVSTPAPSEDVTSGNIRMEIMRDINFDVKAFLNPGGDQFSLYLEGANNEKVSIKVYDALGRELKKFEKDNGNIPIRFGKDLKGGVYFVEVRQDTNRKVIKLIKQN